MIEDSNQSKAQWNRKINFHLHYLRKDNTQFFNKTSGMCFIKYSHVCQDGKIKDVIEDQEW